MRVALAARAQLLRFLASKYFVRRYPDTRNVDAHVLYAVSVEHLNLAVVHLTGRRGGGGEQEGSRMFAEIRSGHGTAWQD